MSRSIIVDDNDVPTIVYNGPWLASERDLPSPRSLGTPFYSNTVHMIATNGSFDYTFRGSKIMVFGYMANLNPKNQESWNCAIDGVTIPNIPIGTSNSTPPLVPNDVFMLCGGDSLADSDPQKLTVTVNTDPEHPFYFDYIEYFPTQAAAFDNATVLINYNDTDINYNGQWNPDPLGWATSGPNTNFNFTFEGVSVALFGYHRDFISKPATDSATYLIDNKDPVLFELSTGSANSSIILFKTPQLLYGTHRLTVVYQSKNANSSSFIFNALIIQNATAPQDPSSTTYPNPAITIPTVTITRAPSFSPDLIATASSSRQKLTPITGGVIGGFVIFFTLVLLLVSCIFLRRRRKNKKAKMQMLLLNSSRKSEIAPHAERTASVYTRRSPGSPQSDSASSSSSLSYTSRSEYHHAQQAPATGYWDAISLDRRTRRNSMANSPWDGIAENGLLERPENLRSPDDSDAKATHLELPSNPAVYLEAHKRALRQLLGTGSSYGSADALRPGADSAFREDVGRNVQSGVPSRPSMFEGLNKEEDRST